MEFNPNTIINDFQKIESLNPTTHELLTKLNLNLGYVAPELAWDRFFNGIRTTKGLCAILSEYESDNDQARRLYESVVERFNANLTSGDIPGLAWSDDPPPKETSGSTLQCPAQADDAQADDTQADDTQATDQ